MSIDPILLLLLIDDEYSMLPDLNIIFGKDVLFKFLEVFAGQTITVPSYHKLKIYTDVINSLSSPDDRSFHIEHISLDHKVSKSYISEIYNKIDKISFELNQKYNVRFTRAK